jgi:hypothetical protein
MRAEREENHSPPSSAELQNVWIRTSITRGSELNEAQGYR